MDDDGARAKRVRLQELIHRRDKVLAVIHPPTAAHGRIMDRCGIEAGFVGTSGVVGTYTGLSDVGAATMTECLQIGHWIARSVSFPIILDGDTGHGGVMAVRRLVHECIRAGIAGVRIDDQPIEGKRMTGSAGIEVVPMEQAIARYRAAVDAKNELDPDFVIMAQCYAGNAYGGSLEKTIARLRAYREDAGVDWVQFEYPKSVDEIRAVRAAVSGPFSFMKGGLGRYLSLKEHLELGVTIAWYPPLAHQVTWQALWNFMQAFGREEMAAWDEFLAASAADPCPNPLDVGPQGEGLAKQRALEEKYFSAALLAKYSARE
jgi:2-methylisocitrate lyase-like PEP mutase family enzyme